MPSSDAPVSELDLLEEPGMLAPDPYFEAEAETTLAYLAGRVHALRAHLASARAVTGSRPAGRDLARDSGGPPAAG